MYKNFLEVKNVNKSFDTLKVLDNVSFNVNKCENVVICGPSGSGKSTLIRCINGLEQYDSGYISVFDRCVSDNMYELSLIRRDVGIVFQDFQLFPHLSVLDNCTLAPMTVNKLSRSDATDIAIAYLDQVGMAGKRSAYPQYLSGGEKQRTAIARALCMDVKIMLYDEPTSALDPGNTLEIISVINNLKKHNMISICITHDLRFAERLADRIIFLQDGNIIEDNDVNAFFHNPQSDITKDFINKAI